MLILHNISKRFFIIFYFYLFIYLKILIFRSLKRVKGTNWPKKPRLFILSLILMLLQTSIISYFWYTGVKS